MKYWLRHETKEKERRTPLTPKNAKKLIESGVKVHVEKSPSRVFPDDLYAKAGCTLVEPGEWIHAPKDFTILGIKELPEDDFALIHNHIFFAHIYKGQVGGEKLIKRFQDGGGKLIDLEYLTDEKGKRVAAFGYWAGYVGAAIAVKVFCFKQSGKLISLPALEAYENKDDLIDELYVDLDIAQVSPKTMIIGAKGRCGTGARDLLSEIELTSTNWDYEETKEGGPFKEILKHDLFINTVFVNSKIPPFLTNELLQEKKKLSVICDVSCDPTSDLNPIPIYSEITSWEKPTIEINDAHLIAIDNLPSILPKESSEDYSNQLFPTLLDSDRIEWTNALKSMDDFITNL